MMRRLKKPEVVVGSGFSGCARVVCSLHLFFLGISITSCSIRTTFTTSTTASTAA